MDVRVLFHREEGIRNTLWKISDPKIIQHIKSNHLADKSILTDSRSQTVTTVMRITLDKLHETLRERRLEKIQDRCL